MLTFVDTNVFVRLIVAADDSGQMTMARELFERAQAGNVNLVTGPPVLFEVAWVLGRLYKMANDEILDFIEAVLSFPNLRVLDKALVVETISLARKGNGTFADSYIVVSAYHVEADNVATFNKKHFSKLGAKLYLFRDISV